jgi:hypothetical protein
VIRFRGGVQVWLFTSRMCEVIQLASMWSGRVCIDVTINAIDDAPLDRMASAMRAEAFSVLLEVAADRAIGDVALAAWLAGSLDTRYRIAFDTVGLRVDWDTGRPTTPLLAEEGEPRR